MPVNSNKINFDSDSEIIGGRLAVLRLQNGSHKRTFADDIKSGLTSVPKSVPPKYFYDDIGSQLFEQICSTPEYYVTRTEAGILEKYSGEIAKLNDGIKNIVELGSGASVKTRYLLKSFLNLAENITYTPIDVSEILVESSKELLSDFKGLSIKGIIGEYEESLAAVKGITSEPKLIIFLGSSIGNFTMEEAAVLLSAISNTMSKNDSFLIGFDLVKDFTVLNSAYDDAQGVTAKFNLNLLSRINNELGGKFDLSKFRHKAFFNSKQSRIEMHLVSTAEHDVCIEAIREKIHFTYGETIHTENSYKFTNEMIAGLASSAGLHIIKKWSDDKNYFGLCMMQKH